MVIFVFTYRKKKVDTSKIWMVDPSGELSRYKGDKDQIRRIVFPDWPKHWVTGEFGHVNEYRFFAKLIKEQIELIGEASGKPFQCHWSGIAKRFAVWIITGRFPAPEPGETLLVNGKSVFCLPKGGQVVEKQVDLSCIGLGTCEYKIFVQ